MPTFQIFSLDSSFVSVCSAAELSVLGVAASGVCLVVLHAASESSIAKMRSATSVFFIFILLIYRNPNIF